MQRDGKWKGHATINGVPSMQEGKIPPLNGAMKSSSPISNGDSKRLKYAKMLVSTASDTIRKKRSISVFTILDSFESVCLRSAKGRDGSSLWGAAEDRNWNKFLIRVISGKK